MANFIPKITWNSGANSYTFAAPPKLDPFNEKVRANNDVTTTTAGNRQVAYNYTEKLWKIDFGFISSNDWNNVLLPFFDSIGKKGTKFQYYPSSDVGTNYTVELDQYEWDPGRVVSDGAGDFLYDVTITLRMAYV